MSFVSLSDNQLKTFPSTRYQGSKRKILNPIYQVSKDYQFNTVLDMFSGSGIVSLLFRAMGKEVWANDFLKNCTGTARLFLGYENNQEPLEEFRKKLNYLLGEAPLEQPGLIEQHFKGIYFKDNENRQLDRFCQNINELDGIKKDLYCYAISQACLKKRPYNLFHRANLNMRTKEIKRSFGNWVTWETDFIDHAYKCLVELEKFSFQPVKNHNVTNFNSTDLHLFDKNTEVVYLDPPYLGSNGTSVDYADFYHFLEGFYDYDLFRSGDLSYPHKPIVNKPSAWLTTAGAERSISDLVDYFDDSVFILNYRSDSTLTHKKVAELMTRPGRSVRVLTSGHYQYALSKNKESEELFIISEPK
jgi:Adenine-specific DNA methylase